MTTTYRKTLNTDRPTNTKRNKKIKRTKKRRRLMKNEKRMTNKTRKRKTETIKTRMGEGTRTNATVPGKNPKGKTRREAKVKRQKMNADQRPYSTT